VIPDAYESPEFLRLFEAYTGSATSIGASFAVASERAHQDDPLIVATGTDVALYPGNGVAPTVENFRVASRGFKEISAISHLGPAVATLARMKELEPHGSWRRDAEELLDSCRAARAANSPSLWQEKLRVAAFAGREAAIAEMADYGCAATERLLERALSDEGYLTADHLRRDYLDGPSDGLPVPINRVMVATFFLAGLDLAHRLIAWFDGLDLPWERTMVIIAGRQGRPTAGVTRDSNSVAGVIHAASRDRLPSSHLLIAPHAPVFAMYDGTNLDGVAALEQDYRQMWSRVVATSDLGGLMFEGYPRFEPVARNHSTLDPDTLSVSEMPAVSGPADWFALTTRLRVVLEDPRQLLSGAVTDYASKQLVANGNDPRRVTVPGLDAEPYPSLTDTPEQSRYETAHHMSTTHHPLGANRSLAKAKGDQQ
jgi:hypothetical protein